MMNKKRGVSFFMAILLMVTLVNPAITSYASAESSTETIEVTEPQQTESSDRPEEDSREVGGRTRFNHRLCYTEWTEIGGNG